MAEKEKSLKQHSPLYYVTQPKLQPITLSSQTTYDTRSSKKVIMEEQEKIPAQEKEQVQTLQDKDATYKELDDKRSRLLAHLGDLRYVEKKKSFPEKKVIQREPTRNKNEADSLEKNKVSIKSEPEKNSTEPVQETLGRKSFKDMTIEEKIQFLLNKPFYIPDVSVSIIAKGNEYAGYVKSFHNGAIHIKQLQYLEPLVLTIEEIDDMRLNPY